MSYFKKRQKAFAEIAAKIMRSKFPVFDAEVAKLAWNLTEEKAAVYNSGSGLRLSLVKKFYVYVLMDPRKPGKWLYTLPGNKTIEFPFEPIYIGKGQRRRVKTHVAHAERILKGTNEFVKSRKLNKLRKIIRLGLEVKEKQISAKDIEAVALAKEIILIKSIGRLDHSTGPLTNGTDGGDGASNPSAEVREKQGRPSRGKKKSMATRKKMSAWQIGKKLSQDTKDKIGAANRGPNLLLRRPKPKVTCPHCGLEGGLNSMVRWHFDNCRNLAKSSDKTKGKK